MQTTKKHTFRRYSAFCEVPSHEPLFRTNFKRNGRYAHIHDGAELDDSALLSVAVR